MRLKMKQNRNYGYSDKIYKMIAQIHKSLIKHTKRLPKLIIKSLLFNRVPIKT